MKSRLLEAVNAAPSDPERIKTAARMKQLIAENARLKEDNARLIQESRYKTSPAQRRAQRKYDEAHREEKRIRMREYMRAKRAGELEPTHEELVTREVHAKDSARQWDMQGKSRFKAMQRR